MIIRVINPCCRVTVLTCDDLVVYDHTSMHHLSFLLQ
jgi:hypothetical protein